MSVKMSVLGCCFAMALAALANESSAQVVQASYNSPGYQEPAVQRPTSQRTTPAMRYFARNRVAVATQAPQSRRPAVIQQQAQPPSAGKPFEYISNRPTITPYLGLDAIQTEEDVPNYYTRVLPRQQQQQANQKQQDELRRLQQQLRLANAPGLNSNPRNAGIPTTGGSQQFLNRGGYFPSLGR